MRNLMRRAIADVQRPIIESVAGVLVVYHSFVTGDSFSLMATPSQSTTNAETSDGVIFTDIQTDWVVEAALFVPYNTTPQRKDKIEWVDGEADVTRWYELLELGGRKAVEPFSNYGDFYRLHTKEVPA